MSSLVDNYNSTNKILTNGSEFIGSYSHSSKYQGVLVTCNTDKDGILSLKWSNDLINEEFSYDYNVTALTPFKTIKQNLGSYIKVSFLNNSGDDQSYLRISTRFIMDVPDEVVIPSTFIMTQLWDNDSVANGNTSVGVDITTVKQVDIFGTVNGSCDLIVQVTDDSTVWYDSSNTIVCANAGDFHTTLMLSAKFVRLCMSSGGTRLITAHLNGK